MITVLVLEAIVFEPHFYVKMDIMNHECDYFADCSLDETCCWYASHSGRNNLQNRDS